MLSTVPVATARTLARPVAQIMHPDPLAIGADAPLAEAAAAMLARRVHALLVEDARGVPLGWVTARGMLHNAPRDWGGAQARDAITEPVCAVSPRATARDALRALLATGGTHVLVRADGGALLGVVSDFDLLRLLRA